jgi:hypothetical protein
MWKRKGNNILKASWSSDFKRKKEWNVHNIANHKLDLLIKEADSYLNHEWYFFDLNGLEEEQIDWHRDPVTGIKSPKKFGFSINHRNEDLVGNIKITWEKNRHHHLTVLAIVYHFTKDEKYAKEVVTQIKSWIQQNPFLIGVNWTHPLEQGIRLISWVWCERLLRSSNHYDQIFLKESEFWDSVYQHQYFIEQTYSRGSSANNHLIGEMAGLYIASTVWPWFDKSKYWKKISKNMLEKEIQKQTFESGINKELAFSYHIFVLEFYLLAVFEAKQAGESFSTSTENLLKKMLNVIPELRDVGKNLPNYGDGDEGMAIQLQSLKGRRDDWLLQLGNSLLGTDTNSKNELTLPFLLFNQPPLSQNGGIKNSLKSSIGYEDAGIYVLSEKRYTDEELFVIADAGPLGFLSIAAHGHADALSFTMSYGGVPFFIDPGTYVYHTDYKWRKYFRGTLAHNTVTVNGMDQSEQAGAFMWTHKARTFVEKWDSKNNILMACHDGYKRSFGVIHHRLFDLKKSALHITDELVGKKNMDVELRFHLHPDCIVNQILNGYSIVNQNKKLEIELPESSNIRVAVGEDFAGWYSPSFNKKVKSQTIIVRQNNTELPKSIKTIIKTVN